MAKKKETMIKHGEPPYLECSSKGDKRFSAYFAVVDGKTIERWYQANKVFEYGITNLSIEQAKGRVSINQEDCAVFYSHLWDEYIAKHPELLEVLLDASGLDRKSTRLNSSHRCISYAVFCL